MVAIANAWEAEGNARPVLNIAGTPALARQLAEGAPADVVITADAQWMDWLAARDLLRDETRVDVVSNSLVLVASVARTVQVTFDDPAARIAMGDPESVPAGRYAQRVLIQSGDWDEVVPRIVPTENVRAALALAERGEVDFAFVYGSDLRERQSSLEIVSQWPASQDLPIDYPMALASGSSHPEAEQLSQYLQSREAGAIFRAHGFTHLPQQVAP